MWYTGRDSNPQFSVSKTDAFASLATRAKKNSWSERQDLNLRTLVSKTSPYSHLRNALKEILDLGFIILDFGLQI
jgi:hypothetical protein